MALTPESVTRSTRDYDDLRRRFVAWVHHRYPEATNVVIDEFVVPEKSGMSSETILFDLVIEPTLEHPPPRRLVARLAPPADAVPIFPSYDLAQQFAVLQFVGAAGTVRVPRLIWFEPDAGAVGAPFFVMERVDGDVPPDVLPYNFGSWLSEATFEQRRRLQDATLAQIARLHALPIEDLRPWLDDDGAPGATPLRRHVARQRSFYEWVAAERRYPVLERAFDWLDEHWPTWESDDGAVLSWGDSRIGNVMYRDFEPVALLDWEMACIGPRELDLGWIIFLHLFFEDIARAIGLPGLPDLFRPDDVAATYAELTGYEPRDLEFFITFAALRHGIVMARVQQRQVFFGEVEPVEDPDATIMHRDSIEALLAGTYFTNRA
jgi:aminoglycoside phosphotransferase (APT) family kinase protein